MLRKGRTTKNDDVNTRLIRARFCKAVGGGIKSQRRNSRWWCETNTNQYQSVTNRPCFALLKVGGEVVEDELKELTETTAFLVENGLLPTIVHGGAAKTSQTTKNHRN